MLPAKIGDVTFASVENLANTHAPESATLDYKAVLPGQTRQDDDRFLADICAFANTRGGDIVYGVTENNGEIAAIPGLGAANVDAFMLRQTNLIRDRIEPQIHGVEHAPLRHADGRLVLVVRIPQSWNAPHRMTPGGPFYARGANGNYQLDIEGVRAAFLAGESLADRLAAFRADRIAKFVGGRTPVPMQPGPYAILHVLPLAAFGRRDLMPLHALPQPCRALPPPIRPGGWSTAITADGFATYGGPRAGSVSYNLVHRNGVLEAVLSIKTPGEAAGIWPALVEHAFVADPGFAPYLLAIEALGLPLPFAVALSLVGIKDERVEAPARRVMQVPVPSRENVVVLPELVVSDTTLPVGRMLRPLFDRMWNIFGWERSLSFNQNDELVQ